MVGRAAGEGSKQPAEPQVPGEITSTMSSEDHERQRLRLSIFDFLRGEKRYRDMIRLDQRPGWLTLCAAAKGWNLGTHTFSYGDELIEDTYEGLEELSYAFLLRVARDLGETKLDDYLANLRRFVADKLGLTSGGVPAEWAVQAVHADIAGGDVDDGLRPVAWLMSPRDPAHKATLEIAIAPGGARWRLRVVGERQRGLPHFVSVAPPFVMNPADKAFRAALHKDLADWLDRVGRDYEAAYGRRSLYAAKGDDRAAWAELLARQYLYGNLIGQQLLDDRYPDSNQKRLRRLAALIGLDPPSFSGRRRRGQNHPTE